MRQAYHRYYKKPGRGFTDAEFERMCEEVAGAPLADVFEYVYTTKEIDYEKYLGYAGLVLTRTGDTSSPKYQLQIGTDVTAKQSALLRAWLGE